LKYKIIVFSGISTTGDDKEILLHAVSWLGACYLISIQPEVY